MIPRTKSSIIFALALIGLLIVGLSVIQYGFVVSGLDTSQAVQVKAKEDIQPVTDCHESRVGATATTRVENAVPQYGYPNVKCSKVSSRVLWYGDPYDGTIPMGDMPALDDPTRGNYTDAVVKPREPHLMYYNMGPEGCAFCHNGKMVPFPKDKSPRLLTMHQDVVENSLQLMHGRQAMWCLDCHNSTDRNTLVDRKGTAFSFNQPQKLCGSCHGEAYIDWRAGIHGKRTGTWATGGKKRWWVCTECHNPHTVQVNRFNPIKPEPAPPLPRGMKNADHERGGH